MEALVPAAVGALCTLVGTAISFVAFWLTLGERRGRTDETAKRAEALAQACLAKTELTAAKLQDHEVKTAAEIAALRANVDAIARSLIEAETRLAKAIEDMGNRFDHMTGRLDSFIDGGGRKRVTSS
jgi:hypothetical protein